MKTRLFLSAGLLGLVAACAVSRQSEEAMPVDLASASKDQRSTPQSAAAEGPVELGCPHTPPVTGFGRGRVVILDLRVLPDGSVDPAGVYPVAETDLGKSAMRDPALIEQAKAIALECRFSPAMVDGKAVTATVRKRFYFTT